MQCINACNIGFVGDKLENIEKENCANIILPKIGLLTFLKFGVNHLNWP